MEPIREKSGFICDMDGVIYHGDKILDGVAEFVTWMINNDKKVHVKRNTNMRLRSI